MPKGTDLTDAEIHAAIQAVTEAGGNLNQAARELGMSWGAVKNRLKRAETSIARKPFDHDPLPDELPTADELLQRRRREFARKNDARSLVPIRIQCDGPIGIALLGDPHVDDPGTDIALLERHVQIINKTDGLFAGNIGDFSNNWVGRLARLYGQQSTSAAEAWVLVEWLVRAVDWCFLIGGNHDCWSGAGDPIQWMARSARVTYEAHGMRLGLTLPNKRVIRLNARHDFSGRSQWNTAHGPAKAVQMGWRDHVLVCGHTHVSGHNVLRDPASGLISHAIRVGSYKTFDRYAEEKGLPNQTFMVAPVVIIRPEFEDTDNRLLTVCYDPETGADFLKFLRKRKAA
jgi:hypothetical protein